MEGNIMDDTGALGAYAFQHLINSELQLIKDRLQKLERGVNIERYHFGKQIAYANLFHDRITALETGMAEVVTARLKAETGDKE